MVGLGRGTDKQKTIKRMAQGHGRVAQVLWSPVRLFSTEEWGPKEKAFTFRLSTFLLNFNVNGLFYMFKSIWVIWINDEIRCHCCYFHIYYSKQNNKLIFWKKWIKRMNQHHGKRNRIISLLIPIHCPSQIVFINEWKSSQFILL